MTLRVPVKFLDGTRYDSITESVLTISDNTTTTKGVISTADIVVPIYGTITLTGYVGNGYKPTMVLVGSEADGNIIIKMQAHLHGTTIVSMSGTVDGFGAHSGGALGDDPADAAATWSSVQTKTGSVAALLTASANEGSVYVQFTPTDTIYLRDIDTITTGWSVAHDLQTGQANGPQVELRFTSATNVNPDGAGHVDITLLPYQQAGTGAWVVSQIVSSTTHAGYYGNDPWDGTAFDEFSGTLHLSAIEAAINAEGAMQANGGFTCGDWVLTRVRVELWEAGVRTCYVDDVTIHGDVYSFEPVWLAGKISGRAP